MFYSFKYVLHSYIFDIRLKRNAEDIYYTKLFTYF